MSAPTAPILTDLDLAVAMLRHKGPVDDRLWAYYEGRQPLKYSSERLQKLFENINTSFVQNWCAVVVDAVAERLQLERITVADDDTASERLAKLMQSSVLLLESDSVHLATLVCGEAYVLVWPDEESGAPTAYYNDPRQVHLFYEADRPHAKRFAAKWWIGDDGHRYLTLYYPDRLEYYRSQKRVMRQDSNGLPTGLNEVSSGKAFDAPTIEANPYGAIPVFHFRRDRRIIASELDNVIQPQDAVNKLLADMMVAAEYGAAPQRYIISQGNPGKFKNAPNMIWDIPAGDGEGQATSAGQFDPTPLANYLDAIDRWVTAIAIISRTPKHYFFGQGGAPSGEALIAMEAPLNHKVEGYIKRLTATWSEVAQFLLRLDGAGEIDDNAIVPIFDQPETIQPYTQALIRKEAIAAGIPLAWQMEQEGYTEQEIADLQTAKEQAMQQQQATLAAAMTNAQRNFDRGGSQNGNEPAMNGNRANA